MRQQGFGATVMPEGGAPNNLAPAGDGGYIDMTSGAYYPPGMIAPNGNGAVAPAPQQAPQMAPQAAPMPAPQPVPMAPPGMPTAPMPSGVGAPMGPMGAPAPVAPVSAQGGVPLQQPLAQAPMTLPPEGTALWPSPMGPQPMGPASAMPMAPMGAMPSGTAGYGQQVPMAPGGVPRKSPWWVWLLAAAAIGGGYYWYQKKQTE